jgi:predicted dehydrogenase
MKLKMAFVGFRHGHIKSLYNTVEKHTELEMVAACEEEPEVAGKLISGINITHNNFEEMLKSIPIDIVAVGDYYSNHGPLMIKALEAGKHVILDKPLCVSLSELDKAERLAEKKGLSIGCMFDLRQYPNYVRTKILVGSGEIGEITAVSFNGQHPLMQNSRPKWYFEGEKHGGTINDIAIHGLDLVEWITGESFTEINSARTWRSPFVKGDADFNDAGQFMMTMSNGCGVLGEVSYFMPNSCGYSLPYYWEFTLWGTKGIIRANLKNEYVELTHNGDKGISYIAQPFQIQPDYLEQFLADIKGNSVELNTEKIISISRKTLKLQEAADKSMPSIKL